jgi:hypothetical protein
MFVQKLFGLEQKKEETRLLSPIVHRLLNKDEYGLFDFDYNYAATNHDMVRLSSRLNLKTKIFYSKTCKNLSKKRSYILSYFDSESNIIFGELEYFIEKENKKYAYIGSLTFVNYIYYNLKGKLNNFLIRLKRKGYFDKFFYIYKRTKNMDITGLIYKIYDYY